MQTNKGHVSRYLLLGICVPSLGARWGKKGFSADGSKASDCCTLRALPSLLYLGISQTLNLLMKHLVG